MIGVNNNFLFIIFKLIGQFSEWELTAIVADGKKSFMKFNQRFSRSTVTVIFVSTDATKEARKVHLCVNCRANPIVISFTLVFHVF